MKKKNIVKNNREFNHIIKTLHPYKYSEYLIYVEKTQKDNPYRFGLSVSKKIGNAVTRNKIKRQLRDIIDEKDYQNGFNCIIIVKKGILNLSYQKMQEDLYQLFKRVAIIKGEQACEKRKME